MKNKCVGYHFVLVGAAVMKGQKRIYAESVE